MASFRILVNSNLKVFRREPAFFNCPTSFRQRLSNLRRRPVRNSCLWIAD